MVTSLFRRSPYIHSLEFGSRNIKFLMSAFLAFFGVEWIQGSQQHFKRKFGYKVEKFSSSDFMSSVSLESTPYYNRCLKTRHKIR
uniref:Secreted protein n=1 Tax=Strongyloides venezuelensis TaxID=75913 RepID=A0A0K0G645_STRVS